MDKSNKYNETKRTFIWNFSTCKGLSKKDFATEYILNMLLDLHNRLLELEKKKEK